MSSKPSPDSSLPPSAPNSLDPPGEEIRHMGSTVVEWMAAYLDGVRDRPVYPQTSAAELQEQLGEPVPEEGRGFDEVFEVFRKVIEPNLRHNAHPRSLGYVSAPGTAIAAIADLLASTLNANVTAWRSAPAAAQLERVTIDWIRQALGLPMSTGGLFTSGGSMANLAALAAARHQQCGEVIRHG